MVDPPQKDLSTLQPPSNDQCLHTGVGRAFRALICTVIALFKACGSTDGKPLLSTVACAADTVVPVEKIVVLDPSLFAFASGPADEVGAVSAAAEATEDDVLDAAAGTADTVDVLVEDVVTVDIVVASEAAAGALDMAPMAATFTFAKASEGHIQEHSQASPESVVPVETPALVLATLAAAEEVIAAAAETAPLILPELSTEAELAAPEATAGETTAMEVMLCAAAAETAGGRALVSEAAAEAAAVATASVELDAAAGASAAALVAAGANVESAAAHVPGTVTVIYLNRDVNL